MEFVSGFKIRDILLHNNNWWRFFSLFFNSIRSSILSNIIKIISCRTAELGYHQWACPSCGNTKQVPHSCKSRFCTSCGKKATEAWIQKQLDVLPNTPWQHITFTLPEELRPLFWLNRHLFNHLMPIPAQIITERAKKKKATPAIFTVLHTFGRDLKPNVHFHVARTVGGLAFDEQSWIDNIYLHHQSIKNSWKARVCEILRHLYKAGLLALPKKMAHIKEQTAFNSWINFLYQKKWVVHLSKPSQNHKQTIRYLGRYLKRPPISETRIKNYDGENVTFSYKDHHDNKTHTKTMSVFDFIKRLISHIPDKYFRLIRYYNWLSNRTRGRVLPIVHRLLNQTITHSQPLRWRQLYFNTFNIDPITCDRCGDLLQLTNIVFSTSSMKLLIQHEALAKSP